MAESNGLPTEAASDASDWRRLVRKGGFEPPRYCYRQPLKLVRLPVPPLPQVDFVDVKDSVNFEIRGQKLEVWASSLRTYFLLLASHF
jgi:hypothetical protein